jgi:hypothetical protein
MSYNAKLPSFSVLGATALGLLGVGLRLASMPRWISDVDGVNFATSLALFDPLKQAPHFPGYPVYVGAAKALQAVGIGDPVWALVLPCLLFWPIACLVFFLGAKRFVGRWTALAAVFVASCTPALVVIGGWPGSDGLGLGTLLFALGALGMGWRQRDDEISDSPGRRKFWYVTGLLMLGVTLGVRLSWLPLVAAIGLLVLWYQRNARGRLVACAGLAAGVAIWLIPLLSIVGIVPFFELATGFTNGHLTEWGNTAVGVGADSTILQRSLRAFWTFWDPGFGAMWPAAVPMSTPSSAAASWGLLNIAISGLVVVGLLGAFQKRKTRRTRVTIVASAALIVPYLLWAIGLQNIGKARHLAVLMPFVGAFVFFGFSHLKHRWIWAGSLATMLIIVSVQRASSQRNILAPAVAVVKWVSAHRAPQGLQVFAGEEARVFQFYAPAFRVLRPVDSQVVEDEVTRLVPLGVEILLTSGSPGVERLKSQLSPVAHFSFPANVRAHDSHMTIYRYVPKVRQKVAYQKSGASR